MKKYFRYSPLLIDKLNLHNVKFDLLIDATIICVYVNNSWYLFNEFKEL